MRRNVLAWLTEQVNDQARHAVILTHNIDFLFVQGVLNPRLRSAGNPRLTIFADAMCAATSWRSDRALLDGLGVRYRVVPVDLGPYRRFHPKALLLANRERAAFAVGSGNLTHGGMAANKEAWAFGVSDGRGAGLIAGFREYVGGLIEELPLADAVRDAIDAAFERDQSWVEELPTPSGLLGSPDGRPLLDRIAELVPGPVRDVSVISPYHDRDAAALAAIHERFQAPVTCWMQQGREGLSREAGARLPPEISLRAIRPRDERQSFIHAKVYAFHRDHDVALVVGSANCSQAALLADESWGNAELVAVEMVSPGTWGELLGELELSEDMPRLPEAPPHDDWEEPPSAALKVLAARQDAGVLKVAFKAFVEVTELRVETDGAAWPVGSGDLARGVITVAAPVRVKTLRLVGLTATGERVDSGDAWVDDEGSLSQPATFRRLIRRLTDPETRSGDPVADYSGLLELFRDYIHDPEARRRYVRRSGSDEANVPRPYDPADVFSSDFGSAAGLPLARGSGTHADDLPDVLAIFRAIFQLSREASPPPPALPAPPEEPEVDPETGEAQAAPDLQEPRRPEPPSEKAKARLRATVKAVEQALSEAAFVNSRSAELLGRDLAVAAALLVHGLADGGLEPAAFRASTRTLWTALFFGEKGEGGGTLLQRLANLEGPHREAFIAAVASPFLSAALALWAHPEWLARDPEAVRFRLSVAEVFDYAPWLFAGGEPAEIRDALAHLAAQLSLNDSDAAAAYQTWKACVRAGHARRALTQALEAGPREAFQAAARTAWYEPNELVWAGKALAFPASRLRRDPAANIPVRFLGAAKDIKFRGAYVFPVRELLEADLLLLPAGGHAEVLRLLDDFEASATCVPA